MPMANNSQAKPHQNPTFTQPKTLIVIAHPKPESFNHAIKETVIAALEKENHLVKVRDLYALEFDPVLSKQELTNYDSHTDEVPADVKAEQEEILWADQLIFIYPTWWWSMPAILKGYFDRVFVPGFAFSVGEEGPNGLLIGKKAWIIQTTGSAKAYMEENQLEKMVKQPLEIGLFNFCGIEVTAHQILPAVAFVSEVERTAMLEQLKALVNEQLSNY